MIENIDIGGPTLIRAAAKNHAFAAVVVAPGELRRGARRAPGVGPAAVAAHAPEPRAWRRSHTPRATTPRSRAGSPSARRTSRPSTRARSRRCSTSPYGENPHQRAAYYAEAGARTHLMSMVSKLHGKELSFNNLLDLDSGRRLIEEFELPAVAIIKHNNPCGVGGRGRRSGDAFDKALATDPQSAFGGVFCFNRPVDRALAEKLQRDVRGGWCSPRATTRTRSSCSSRSRTCACSRTRSGAPRRSPSTTSSACAAASSCRTATPGSSSARRCSVATHAQAERGGVGRAAVRHARVQARALERDRAVEGARDRRDRRGPDEPRGLGADRGRQGGRCGAGAGRRGDGLGRVLPVRRRAPGSRSTPACGRSSSRAGRSATTRSSRPATPRAWRWCSRRAATSATEPWSFAGFDIYRTDDYS